MERTVLFNGSGDITGVYDGYAEDLAKARGLRIVWGRGNEGGQMFHPDGRLALSFICTQVTS